MTSDINQTSDNIYCNLSDITRFSSKSLEDYSIVNRKYLERIINNSERCLTEDEHRWLIKRDCRKVISDIKKYTRKKKSKRNLRDERGEENNSVKMTTSAINRYILTNSMLYTNVMPVNSVLNTDSGIVAVDGRNCFNVIIENSLTVVNVHQINININTNNAYEVFEYDNIDETFGKNNSEVIIMDLERIYWDKWRNYVKKKMAVRTNRCEKIDSFLLKIQEKLNADQSKKSSKLHKVSNRIAPKQLKTTYDRQQSKIENQKKLLEKQQKEIERLKLQQLKLESEKAMLENQKNFNQTFDKSEKRLRIKHFQRQRSVVKASTSDLLNRMEIRALDRQAKWNAIRERRKKMEQEEQKKKQELEEKCLREQMEQRRKKLFEARENLKLKRVEECKKQAERDIWYKNVKIADEFYKRLLLKKGFDAFRVNLINARKQMQEASNYCNRRLLGLCFSKWRFFVDNNSNEKILLAEQFYKRKLMKMAFLGFVKTREESKKKEQVAEDWHNFKIQELCFVQWLTHVRKINVEVHKKMSEAESYHNRVLMKRCFDNWRKLPEIVYKERLKDCRLRMWREKVQEILPDFTPPEL